MGCFPCFDSSNKEGNGVKEVSKKDIGKEGSAPHQSHHVNRVSSGKSKSRVSLDPKKDQMVTKDGQTANIAAQTFTFRELAAATKNFRPESMLGEGGFGRVYKGRLDSTGQVVAVKQLDRNGLQGNREFLVEVLMLSLLHHPNLVNLIGYCADGDQRLLVYEFMPLGSLEDHLHDLPPDKEPLDWNTRMKIAAGAAKGQLTLKSDVYSFGVVFLELITGRKAIDNTRAPGEHNLVAWARPLFKDRRKFPKMADPLLQGRYPVRGLYQALAVAAMCLQEQAATRPLIGDVVTALTYLASQPYDPEAARAERSARGSGSGTPRSRADRRNPSDGGLDDSSMPRAHGSPSTYKNSPEYRKRESLREINTRGADLADGETSNGGGGSGRKWGVVEDSDSQRNSPANTSSRGRNRDLERERAVAEAKVWGENWRDRKRTNTTSGGGSGSGGGGGGGGSFDATNE
ncbi:unnamed protein product [Lactuca virosa]|uniref:Protein kinase domain-containing protein n=1 Tax=Lactuca virosa TaxID=75947 RepID=A0AAU9LNV0_9ASTR|nr:unnamed protein product [Lactuca virosa]